MGEKRTSSQDTVPIDQEELRARLREVYGPEVGAEYAPVPDERPTEPDLESPCKRCRGTGRCVVATSRTSFAGPRPCPRCGGSRIDPGTRFDPEDPFAGDVPDEA